MNRLPVSPNGNVLQSHCMSTQACQRHSDFLIRVCAGGSVHHFTWRGSTVTVEVQDPFTRTLLPLLITSPARFVLHPPALTSGSHESLYSYFFFFFCLFKNFALWNLAVRDLLASFTQRGSLDTHSRFRAGQWCVPLCRGGALHGL